MSDKPLVALITGTRKGIGLHLARHCAERGMATIGCSRGPAAFEAKNYEHIQTDVTNEDQIKKVMAAIQERHGRLDVLINNAGIASMNHVLLTPTETARRVMETNFLGTFILCREAARVMRKNQFGRIVNVGTVAVPMLIEGEAIYAASKSAVLTFTQILAKELASFKITCNTVGPSPIETDLIRSVPRDKIQRLLDGLAIKRLGTVADVTNVIDFFLRKESDYITGQVIYLGGVA